MPITGKANGIGIILIGIKHCRALQRRVVDGVPPQKEEGARKQWYPLEM